jgi:hypothetical protein
MDMLYYGARGRNEHCWFFNEGIVKSRFFRSSALPLCSFFLLFLTYLLSKENKEHVKKCNQTSRNFDLKIY